jgi:trk system potassium uptake protein TrkH
MIARLMALPMLVTLTGVTAALCALPALHAFMTDDHATARGFLYAGLVLMVLATMVGIVTAGWRPAHVARAHLVSLALAYLVLPLAMALPMLQVVPATTLVNAWFEMISAFTTTGATVYDPARLAPSVHLWRASVAWLGGFYALLTAFAVLAPLNLGGVEVASGRVPGRLAAGAAHAAPVDPAARLARYAMALLPVYAGVTLALWVGLLIAGDRPLVALVHAMGTLSTAGISAEPGGVGAGSGFAGELIVALGLCLALTRRFYPGAGLTARDAGLWRDPELRVAAAILVAVPSILFLRHWLAGPTSGAALTGAEEGVHALWGAAFTALSFLTTTGYASAYWSEAQGWAGLGAPGLLLLGLGIVGGGVATTAGGVKLLRLATLLRHSGRELERVIHPRSIAGGGPDDRRLLTEGAYFAWVFFMLFATSIAAGMMALSLAGVEFETALVLTIAALTTTGPLAEVATAEPIAYAPLGPGVKLILGALMIVGRLETLALLALLSPASWRR